jgi:hypothetical protein
LKKHEDVYGTRLAMNYAPRGRTPPLIVYVLLFAMAALAVVTFTGFITESEHRRAPKR